MILRVFFGSVAVLMLFIVNITIQRAPGGACWLKQQIGESCRVTPPMPVRKS